MDLDLLTALHPLIKKKGKEGSRIPGKGLENERMKMVDNKWRWEKGRDPISVATIGT